MSAILFFTKRYTFGGAQGMDTMANGVKRPGALEWRAAIARYEGGGVSQAKMCEEMGVSLSTFQYWLQRIRREGSGSPREGGSSGGSGFSKYRLVSEDTAAVSAEYEIVLCNGRRVVVRGSDIDVLVVQRLVTALEVKEPS